MISGLQIAHERKTSLRAVCGTMLSTATGSIRLHNGDLVV